MIGTRIKRRFILIGLLMGLFALALERKFGWSWLSVELFIFITALIAIAFIDLDTWLIPWSLTLLIVFSGLGFGYFCEPQGVLHTGLASFYMRISGAFGGFFFLSALLVVSTWILRHFHCLAPDQFAMGLGDPILIGAIGASVGALNLPLVILLAGLQGIVGFFLIRTSQISDKIAWRAPSGAIPFGPFLALAGIEVVLLAPEIYRVGQQFAIFFRNW